MTDDPIVPEGDAATLAFPDCDLLQLVPERPPGGRARCARCARVLATRSSSPIDRPLALSLTALLVLIVANTTSLMGLWVAGRQASTTIGGGAYQMWLQGQEVTAVIVAFCALIAPAAYILFMLIVLLAAKRPPAPLWVGEMLRLADAMQPWAMVEVMMLGTWSRSSRLPNWRMWSPTSACTQSASWYCFFLLSRSAWIRRKSGRDSSGPTESRRLRRLKPRPPNRRPPARHHERIPADCGSGRAG